MPSSATDGGEAEGNRPIWFKMPQISLAQITVNERVSNRLDIEPVGGLCRHRWPRHSAQIVASLTAGRMSGPNVLSVLPCLREGGPAILASGSSAWSCGVLQGVLYSPRYCPCTVQWTPVVPPLMYLPGSWLPKKTAAKTATQTLFL